MTHEPAYNLTRIGSQSGVAYYKLEADTPDAAYREFFPHIAAAYEAAAAENAKGLALRAEYDEAVKALRAHQRGLRDDEYSDPTDEAKLTTAVRKAEREMDKQSPVSKRALIAYDKLVVEQMVKGGIVGVSRERAAAAQARVLALSAELVAALRERENAWSLAGSPLGYPADPGAVMKRAIDAGNDVRAAEHLLKRLSAFPDLSGPAEPEMSPAEHRAETDRQNAEAARAVKARSRREGF